MTDRDRTGGLRLAVHSASTSDAPSPVRWPTATAPAVCAWLLIRSPRDAGRPRV